MLRMKVSRSISGGFSLVEVMIAVTILLVVGGILLNGLLNQQKTTGKVTFNSQALSDLSSAAGSIAATPYVPCGSSQDATNLNPYSNVNRPTLVQIDSVEGLTKAKAWKPCGDAAWQSEAPMIQRVKISTPVSAIANSKKISRTVLKYFSGSAGSYDQSYKVNNLAVSMGPATSTDSTKTTSTQLLTATKDQGLTCFFLFPATYSGLTASIPSNTACGTSAQITITLGLAATGTYLIDVGAFNKTNGKLAIVGTINVTVRPPLALTATVVNTAGSTTTLLCNGFRNSMPYTTSSSGSGSSKRYSYTFGAAVPCKVTVSPVEGTGEGGFVFTSWSYSLAGTYPESDIVVGTLPSGATTPTPFTVEVSVSSGSLTVTLNLKAGTNLTNQTISSLPPWTDLCSYTNGTATAGKPQSATATLNFKQSTGSTIVIPIAIGITC